MPFKLLKASSENERIYGFYFTVKTQICRKMKWIEEEETERAALKTAEKRINKNCGMKMTEFPVWVFKATENLYIAIRL